MDLDSRCFTRKGNHLVPSDFVADETVLSIKEGGEVMVRVWKARSPKYHRYFFAMLRIVLGNLDEETSRWSDERDLLDALKLATGHYRIVIGFDGASTVALDSIAFESMDEIKFRTFFEKCLLHIQLRLGIDAQELMDETDRLEGAVWKRTKSLKGIANFP